MEHLPFSLRPGDKLETSNFQENCGSALYMKPSAKLM